MKKLLLTLAGIAMVAGCAMAQDYKKSIFGVNAGLNVSSLSMTDMKDASGIGFHAGITYEHLLLKSRPLYLETGLAFSMRNSVFEDYGEKIKAGAYYLELPLMINYKFFVTPDFSVAPSIGVYYAFGLGGKFKYDLPKEYQEYYGDIDMKMFGKEGPMKRSDFGLRFGLTAAYRRVSLSLGYELGLMNVAKNDTSGDFDYDYFDYDYDYYYSEPTVKAKTGNFYLSLGFKF